jgi:hypothetical protein
MSSAAPLHDVVDADEEAVASAHDNGDVIPSEEGKCGLCQKLFIDSGNDKKVLHLMSIGVSADNENVEPLCSFEREPWSMLPKTVGMRPRNTEYVEETFLTLVQLKSPTKISTGCVRCPPIQRTRPCRTSLLPVTMTLLPLPMPIQLVMMTCLMSMSTAEEILLETIRKGLQR